jgi:hypothetical protein
MFDYLEKLYKTGILECTPGQFNSIMNESGCLYKAPLSIAGPNILTFEDIKKQVQTLKTQQDVKILFVDGLNMIHGYRGNKNALFKSLKDIANELNIVIIGLLTIPKRIPQKSYRSLIPTESDMFMVLDLKPGAVFNGNDVAEMRIFSFEKEITPRLGERFYSKNIDLYFHPGYSLFGRSIRGDYIRTGKRKTRTYEKNQPELF